MERLDEDIIYEIMQRIPLKSVLQCTCLSKEWNMIIHRYLIQSMRKPRLLFAFYRRSLDRGSHLLLHSIYQQKNLWLLSDQQQTHIPSGEKYDMHSGPLRGLVCLQSCTKVVLCNPATKKLLILPDYKEHIMFHDGKCFLGYDEDTDVLKVLLSVSVFHRDIRQMYNRVLTVGPGEKYWRPIECEQCYLSVTNGICIKGILYYGACAWSQERYRAELPIVMSFNVMSEEFNVIELPEGIEILIDDTKLVNYNGEVALVTGSGNDLFENGGFQLCVRDESAGIWRIERIVIPGWRHTAQSNLFSFQGTIGTGELIFSNQSSKYRSGEHLVLYYDPVTKNLTKFKIQGVHERHWLYAETFVNHFDTLLLTQE